MSGLACCFHRGGAPAGEGDLAAIAAQLAWRGSDGSGRRQVGPIALASWHSWTTPEEVGEVGPREHQAAGLLLAFDGRLDNRAELGRALAIADLATLSDAELVLRAWLAWEEAALPRLLGPFALIVAEPRARRLTLARDPVGHRGLAFHLRADLLLAASDEFALAADPRVGRALDESMLALYFSLEERVDGRTFFRGIEQLLPGELLRVGPGSAERRLFYRPRLDSPGGRRQSSLEWQELFRATAQEAVACRLRTRATPAGAAMLLSGGLDSTAIAALARAARPEARLAAFTWSFPERPECDESALAAATCRQLELDFHPVLCGDAGPLAGLTPATLDDGAAWPLHPGTPEQNAYRLFHQRAYQAAAAAGAPVVLSGMGGDQLYAGADSFVASLVRERRLAALPGELLWHLRQGRLGLAAFRDLLPFGYLWRRRRRRRALSAPWLTAAALLRLPTAPPWPSWAGEAPRPEQVMRLFEPTGAHGINVECYYALRVGVSLRYPWRDLRVLELALQLPGSELRRRDGDRLILRSSLRHMMPQNVLERKTKTSFESIFRHSLFGQQKAVVDALLDRPTARWPEFVERSFLERQRERPETPVGFLMVWMCLALELWLLRQQQG